MIRKLLATTAIATFIAAGATGAYAQTAPAQPVAPAEQAVPTVINAEGHLASNIIGQTVYNSAANDAENIGSVTDLVISDDGDIEAVVVGVGGFLGIGQKNVALEFDTVEWVERDGSQWLVIPTNRAALEALPEFDTAAYRPMPADAAIGNTKPATAEDIGAKTTAPGVTDTTTRTEAIDRSTLTVVPVEGVSADQFIGTTVYGANDENVGSIEDVILATDGKAVEAVVLDVGGFLGIGAKPVAVGMDNLSFMKDADGKTYLYTQFSKEQLEAQPEYDAKTFAQDRDKQLLIVPAN